MAFTAVTITHTFDLAAGAAAGDVTFQLLQTMTNGAETHVSGETIEAPLAGGVLSAVVPATDDTGTVPTDTYWLVTIRLTSEQARNETYFIKVPHAVTPVDLFALIPTTYQVA